MLATVLEWLTDFLTGAIMESRKAARSKAVASPPWLSFIVYIVILVLDSFRKQGIVFWFFTLEYEVGEIK